MAFTPCETSNPDWLSLQKNVVKVSKYRIQNYFNLTIVAIVNVNEDQIETKMTKIFEKI